MSDTTKALELVKRARELERLLARRRRYAAIVAGLDESIRTAKRLLRDLTAPDPPDVSEPLPGEEPRS
jgi:hypothetical protein